jgi:hypothetical protein
MLLLDQTGVVSETGHGQDFARVQGRILVEERSNRESSSLDALR